MDNTLEYREFTAADFDEVVDLQLREIEVREGRASLGMESLEALSLSISTSRHLWVITYKGKICGVFGLAIQGETGIPWLLSNEVPFSLQSNRGLFLRESRKVVEYMKTKCDLLTNSVSIENHESIRWLRWLGFTVDDKNLFTFERDPTLLFARFTMRTGGLQACVTQQYTQE